MKRCFLNVKISLLWWLSILLPTSKSRIILVIGGNQYVLVDQSVYLWCAIDVLSLFLPFKLKFTNTNIGTQFSFRTKYFYSEGILLNQKQLWEALIDKELSDKWNLAGSSSARQVVLGQSSNRNFWFSGSAIRKSIKHQSTGLYWPLN